MRFLVFTLFLTLSLCLPISAANLLNNGDFENTSSSVPANGLINGKALNALAPGNGWDVYSSIPFWGTTPNFIGGVDCTPCTPAGIEVQHNTVVTAHSDAHYIELDSHRANGGGSTNSAMSQSIFLTAGEYELSYWYRPRTYSAGDSGIKVFVGTDATPSAADEIPLLFGNGVVGSGWTQLFATFIVSADTYRVTFAAVGRDNTYGGFIDDVNLEKLEVPQETPEPATMGALGLGLVALAITRRLRKEKVTT